MPYMPIQALPYADTRLSDTVGGLTKVMGGYIKARQDQQEVQRKTALEQLKQLLEQAKFDEDKRKNLAGETQTAAFQTETGNLARDKFDWSKGAPIIAAAGSNVLTRQSPDAGGAGMPPPSSGAMTDSFGQSAPQTPWDYMTQTGLGRGTPTLPPMAAQTAPTAAPTVPGFNVTTFPKEPQPFNLGPGQFRFGGAGGPPIASVPMSPSQRGAGADNAAARQQAGFANAAARQQWTAEKENRQKATERLSKAHDNYTTQYDDFSTKISAIDGLLNDGTTNWGASTVTDDQRANARAAILKRMDALTKRYQGQAKASGWDEQGNWVGRGKGRPATGKAASTAGRVIRYDATGRRTQ